MRDGGGGDGYEEMMYDRHLRRLERLLRAAESKRKLTALDVRRPDDQVESPTVAADFSGGPLQNAGDNA